MFLTFLLSILLQYADPFVGTDAHGHTFPGAVYPFGMIQLSPDTRPKAGDWDGCSGYHYSDHIIYGFSHTHLSGTGCDDWCDILVTPGSGPSAFSHCREKASPGYYEVYLEDSRVLARLAAGKRAAMHEYRFGRGAVPQISIDLSHRDYLAAYEIDYGNNWCSGRRRSDSWARGQELYFYIEFSAEAACSLEKDGAKAVFRFADGTRRVTLRAAISSVSAENAKENLYSEYPLSFDSLKDASAKAWEEYLGRLACPYGDKEHRRRFYTALYHTGIHPSLYSDFNGQYRGMDGEIHRADGWERYTVFSTWDTFRGEHPLLCMIAPEKNLDFIKSMLSIYDENGKLPVWELSGYETDCMIGYNSAPIIADAIMRGLTDFDVEKALEAMVASSMRPEHGMKSFRENGLVLADDEHESVSKTLEFAYDDWCVAQVAAYLGRNDIYEKYMRSSQYWRNVMDPQTGFMRARLNGRWYAPFDPREVNNHYTEANSWQYSFFVPHDIPGLISAYGGAEAFDARLDSLFGGPSGTTGRTQADITGCIGQYAHGNEPSHHIAMLYNYTGHPEKAARTASRILEELYSSAPDGLCGNDDCGQMSAWYVLNSIGRYPVCPGASDGPQQPYAQTIVCNPYFVMDSDIFTDSLRVSIGGEGRIMYRIGEGEFKAYGGPFTVREACRLEAYSCLGENRSFVTASSVHKVKTDRRIELHSGYSRQYTAGGPDGLIDGHRGGLNWRTGGWQGYQDTDFEAVVDLLSVRRISRIGSGFCQDARSWIWMPEYVEFYVSSDGIDYTLLERVQNTVDERDMQVQVWDCEIAADTEARYVKVFARNIGEIPQWHPGAGYSGFIFTDEIWVE